MGGQRAQQNINPPSGLDNYLKTHTTTPVAAQGGPKNMTVVDAQMQARMNEYLNSGVNMDPTNQQMFHRVGQAGNTINVKKPQSDGRVIRKQNYSQTAQHSMAEKSNMKHIRAASEIKNEHHGDNEELNQHAQMNSNMKKRGHSLSH